MDREKDNTADRGELAEKISEDIERDSRRYERAFTEEQEVKLRWN